VLIEPRNRTQSHSFQPVRRSRAEGRCSFDVVADADAAVEGTRSCAARARASVLPSASMVNKSGAVGRNSLGLCILKGLACAGGASALFAIGLPTVFLAFELMGMAGSLAQRIPPPNVMHDGPLFERMAEALAIVLVPASLPTGIVLGLGASRCSTNRLQRLLVLGGMMMFAQALLAAYPVAALSPYFLSNTPPAAPFPFGADWHVPFQLVVMMAWFGLAFCPFLLAPLVLAGVWGLERWTRSR